MALGRLVQAGMQQFPQNFGPWQTQANAAGMTFQNWANKNVKSAGWGGAWKPVSNPMNVLPGINLNQWQNIVKLGAAGSLGYGAFGPGGFATGAKAGAGAGASGSFGTGASASTINPFEVNAGLGTSWAPISGGAGAGLTGIPAGSVSPTTISPTLPGAGGQVGGAGGFYGPAGNWTAGAPAGNYGTLAGTGGGGFWGGTTGQTIINSGLNVFSGLLQNLAIQKAQGASQAAIDARIKQALATLSPEHIMALAQQFLPQMAANANVAGQTAIQAVREQAARTGQLEGPRALSFEAGTRAKLAGDVQQRAFEAAMNTAGGQASAITGAPYTPIQPQTGIADAIANSVNQAYQARFYQQANQQNQGTPWRYPYNPWTGQPNAGGA